MPERKVITRNLDLELTGIVNLLPQWKEVLSDIFHSGNYYRLLLRHRDNEILNLPWNMAIDKNSGKPLGLSNSSIFARESAIISGKKPPLLQLPHRSKYW